MVAALTIRKDVPNIIAALNGRTDTRVEINFPRNGTTPKDVGREKMKVDRMELIAALQNNPENVLKDYAGGYFYGPGGITYRF